jgi:Zn-dependent protease with chaperone function
MFNNIIYFLVVLLIFNVGPFELTPESSFSLSLAMFFAVWIGFGVNCRLAFGRLSARGAQWTPLGEARMSGLYHRLIARCSMLAVFIFALDVYILHLKHWLHAVPWVERFSTLEGIAALSIFFLYLATLWYFAFPAYQKVFRSGIDRAAFVKSNFNLNLPVLFPWLAISAVYDAVSLSPFPQVKGFLNTIEGQMLFFACFLSVLMIFMPHLVQSWWGCRPLEPSFKSTQLRSFLDAKRFKVRHILKWPLFEGKALTAGIMGVLPRFRYILVTDALLEVLSTEELKAVLAHEMGHAKYRHFFFYLIFFVGYMVLSFGLFDLFFYLYAASSLFGAESLVGGGGELNLFHLALSLPMLLSLLIYFRYVMGFFMRNFERQADLYSAQVMGSPEFTTSSLEKIAYLSGNTRDVPSWHHFSIRERVEYLGRMLKDPHLLRKHNRFLALCLAGYLVLMICGGYVINFSPLKHRLNQRMVVSLIERQIGKEPENLLLKEALAMAYEEAGKRKEAAALYEEILAKDPNRATALNNLAWFLATAPEAGTQDRARALELAKRAVSLERSPIFLDTLAEAYFVNGLFQDAITTIGEAISTATKNRPYYEAQLRKFQSGKRR